MESPGNLMNPTVFCNTVKDKLESCGMYPLTKRKTASEVFSEQAVM